jgi:hypothetical protein
VTAAPRIVLELPGILRDVVGVATMRLRAATLDAALKEAFARRPVLRHHLCGDDGGLRPHVLCLVNGERAASLRIALRKGDRIEIHQAISGG